MRPSRKRRAHRTPLKRTARDSHQRITHTIHHPPSPTPHLPPHPTCAPTPPAHPTCPHTHLHRAPASRSYFASALSILVMVLMGICGWVAYGHYGAVIAPISFLSVPWLVT